jgi:hypothetical protein
VICRERGEAVDLKLVVVVDQTPYMLGICLTKRQCDSKHLPLQLGVRPGAA